MKELKNRISTAGTPGYIAPEVWNLSESTKEHDRGGYTYSSDVYSFGILIFEILSFRRPFESLRGMAIQQQLLDSKKTYADLIGGLSKEQVKLYDPLLRLFSQCSSLEPGERPSPSYIVMLLRNLLVECGVKLPPSPRGSNKNNPNTPTAQRK